MKQFKERGKKSMRRKKKQTKKRRKGDGKWKKTKKRSSKRRISMPNHVRMFSIFLVEVEQWNIFIYW